MIRKYGLLALGLILILAGSILAHDVQTTHAVSYTHLTLPTNREV